MTRFVKEVYETGIVLEAMNRSLLCLLPKQSKPEMIAQFRPICLSNVIIKIIIKTIENRLKLVMGDLVGVEKAFFISRQHTIDNIVISQELFDLMRRKKVLKGL